LGSRIRAESGRKVALLVTEIAQRDAASLSEPGVRLWTVPDGKATNFRAFAGAPTSAIRQACWRFPKYAVDEFWS
jgi:hypothetical protein